MSPRSPGSNEKFSETKRNGRLGKGYLPMAFFPFRSCISEQRREQEERRSRAEVNKNPGSVKTTVRGT